MSDIASMQNFLDVILIPRTVDSDGSKFVRTFISNFLSDIGWFVDQHSFSQVPFSIKCDVFKIIVASFT